MPGLSQPNKVFFPWVSRFGSSWLSWSFSQEIVLTFFPHFAWIKRIFVEKNSSYMDLLFSDLNSSEIAQVYNMKNVINNLWLRVWYAHRFVIQVPTMSRAPYFVSETINLNQWKAATGRQNHKRETLRQHFDTFRNSMHSLSKASTNRQGAENILDVTNAPGWLLTTWP